MRKHNKRFFRESYLGKFPVVGGSCENFVRSIFNDGNAAGYKCNRLVFNTYYGKNDLCGGNLDLRNGKFNIKDHGPCVEFTNLSNGNNLYFELYYKGLVVTKINDFQSSDGFILLECENAVINSRYVLVLVKAWQ